MSRPRVVVLRGHNANPWELRSWELLADRFDVVLGVTGSNRYDVDAVDLPRVRARALRDWLPRGRAGDLGAVALGDRYVGLEEVLSGADVVHSAELGVWFSGQPAELKRRLGFRFVLTAWETIPFSDTFRSSRGRAHRRTALAEADLYLAATERARRCLLLEGAPDSRIVVSPPGIDVERFASARGEPAATHVVVSPGRLVWEKGHQDVIRAISALRRGLVPGDAPRLLIVGTGPERTRLERHARELGVDDLVTFDAVPYERMPEVMARASRLVLASLVTPVWEEQFGMVLAEAMAAQVPIAASRSGAIPEVVGDAADLFEPGDWLALARLLGAAPESTPDPDLVRRYSLAAAAERLEAAYRRVLGD